MALALLFQQSPRFHSLLSKNKSNAHDETFCSLLSNHNIDDTRLRHEFINTPACIYVAGRAQVKQAFCHDTLLQSTQGEKSKNGKYRWWCHCAL